MKHMDEAHQAALGIVPLPDPSALKALFASAVKALAAQGFVVDSTTGSLGSQLDPLTIALNSER